MYYTNPRIEKLYRIFDQNERKDYLRLDLNENPGGLPEDFVRNVLEGVDPQLVAQYPSEDMIGRSSIMVYFDAEQNEVINQMWINVRCFNIHDVPWWAWTITVVIGVVIVFLFIKERQRQKLYR